MVELFPSTLPIYTNLRATAAGRTWLDQLPALVAALTGQWSLMPAAPYPSGSCSWAAPVSRADETAAVLKLSWPHREAAGEAAALRAWNGDGAIRLLAHDPDRHALLLERAQPGTGLAAAENLAVEQRLDIGCGVLRHLWSAPVDAVEVEPLSAVMNGWADDLDERRSRRHVSLDPGLLAHGARLLRQLPLTASRAVLLHGDFNPGNILAATRRPWLAIDPKPMTGDPAYDPVPLIEQIDDPYQHPQPHRVLRHRTAYVADQLGIDADRILA